MTRAGLLPIPAQSWKSNQAASIVDQDAAKPAVRSAPVNPTGSQGDNVDAKIEAEVQNRKDEDKITEIQEDEEDIVIRRVGFVFLAYNVEFW